MCPGQPLCFTFSLNGLEEVGYVDAYGHTVTRCLPDNCEDLNNDFIVCGTDTPCVYFALPDGLPCYWINFSFGSVVYLIFNNFAPGFPAVQYRCDADSFDCNGVSTFSLSCVTKSPSPPGTNPFTNFCFG